MENPIPFADSAAVRTLSLGYLHAKYGSLLLAPLHLSADWSFACIPLVHSWTDPRNLLSLALYTWLACSLLSIRPWALPPELWLRLQGAPRRCACHWAGACPQAL